jgi:hypothetical protein
MNLTSLITLPVRIGYEVARKTIDVAAGAARLVGVGGRPEAAVPRAPAPQPPRSERPARPKPAATPGTRAATAKPKPKPPKRAAARKPTPAKKPKPAGRPGPMGSSPAPAADSGELPLARRVEIEIFRDSYAPGITVDVNPIVGVVKLRGQATGPEQLRQLQRRALSVPGVKRVESLLILPDSGDVRSTIP